jgi:RimJ/RimL family protein N-acetyltransferase
MPTLFPGPAYRVVTPRLVIRCWDPADAPMMKASIDESLEHLRPFMPWAAKEPTDLQVKVERLRRCRGQFDLGEDFLYGVFNRDETRVLGGTGLHTRVGPDAREIGYWIHADFINQGYASEVSAALTRVAFEVDGMRRVEIHMATENGPSAAVPRKLGYTHEATLRQRTLLTDGRYHDAMVWTLLKDDYPSSPSAKLEVQAYDCLGRQIL